MQKGQMDGWHGDEHECWGNCGICEDCMLVKEKQWEEKYLSLKFNQIDCLAEFNKFFADNFTDLLL